MSETVRQHLALCEGCGKVRKMQEINMISMNMMKIIISDFGSLILRSV